MQAVNESLCFSLHSKGTLETNAKCPNAIEDWIRVPKQEEKGSNTEREREKVRERERESASVSQELRSTEAQQVLILSGSTGQLPGRVVIPPCKKAERDQPCFTQLPSKQD